MNTSEIPLYPHDVLTLKGVQMYGPVSAAVLRAAEAKRKPVDAPLANRLADLLELKLLQRTKSKGGAYLYTITQAGTVALALNALNGAGGPVDSLEQLDSVVRAPAPPRSHARAGTYNGAELKPYTGRGPGALQAFALPSLVNGKRVERMRAPIILSSTPRGSAPDTGDSDATR